MMEHFQIYSNEETTTSMASIDFLLKQLHSMKDKKGFFTTPLVTRLQIHKDKQKKVCFTIGTNIKSYQVREYFEKEYGVEAIRPVEPITFCDIGKTIKAQNKLYPMKFKEVLDNIVANIPEGVLLTFDIQRDAGKTLGKIKIEEDKLNKQKDTSSTHKSRKEQLKKRLAEAHYTFDVDIYLNALEEQYKNNIFNFGKHLRFFTEDRFNGLKLKKVSSGLYPGDAITFKRKSDVVLTEKELAEMFSVPPVKKYPEKLYSAKPDVNPNDFSVGITVGQTTLQDGTVIDLRIPLEQLESHIFLCAKTGGGKSAQLMTFFSSLIEEHKMKYGATVIDPNEETLLKILNHMLEKEQRGIDIDWNKVHYIDLATGEYLPFLNLLNIPTGENDIDTIQNYIMETLKSVYPGQATPLIDEQLRKVIGTLLLEKNVVNTILDGKDLLTEPERQMEAIKRMGSGYYEETYKKLWKAEMKESDIASTLRRLSLFQTPQMQRLYGIPEFNLPIRKWMDEGHFVLINTKGMSDERLRLNAGHVFSQYVMVAKQRPTTGSRPHFLVVDEGKQIQLPIIWKNIIPETRKFGLYLVESTQSITSLDKVFENEISENIKTIISGELGKNGAPIVAKMMNNKINETQLKSLKKLHLYVYTAGKSGENVAVEIQVKPPYWYYKNTQGKVEVASHKNKIQEDAAYKWSMEKAIELQKRDWKHKDEIDEMLLQRYGNIQSSGLNPQSNQEVENERSSFYD